jgi:hypothetical protein
MLVKDYILSKYKVNSLDEINNINLWGCDLNNIDIISEMKNLEVASLSLNKISSLKPFQNLPNLKELYLRKNNISDIKEIEYLKQCPNLKIIWIEENPLCQKDPNYQKEIIKVLPQIIKLDNKAVKDILNEEKNNNKDEIKNNFDNLNTLNNHNFNIKEEPQINILDKREENKNDIINEMKNDLFDLQRTKNENTNIKNEKVFDKTVDNNLIQEILSQKNIESTIKKSNYNQNLNLNINQYSDNTLVKDILKDVDTSQTFINKNKRKDILKDIDINNVFNKNEIPIMNFEENYPNNLESIEQIKNYFNNPKKQNQKKNLNNMQSIPYNDNIYYDMSNYNNINNNYYNNNYNKQMEYMSEKINPFYMNTQKMKAVLNLIEILEPTDLLHLRNDIIKRIKNENY